MKRPELWLFVAAGLVAVWFARAAWLKLGGAPGLPLDDAWIHLRFAGNLAAGHGLSFNPGVPSAGATSPLWVLLLAPLWWLPLAPARASAFLSALCFAGACVLSARLAVVLMRRTASVFSGPLAPGPATFPLSLMGGLLAASTGRFAWSALSGMEVGLAAVAHLSAMLLGLGWREQAKPQPVAASLVGGLAVLVRPESVLLLVLLQMFILWDRGLPRRQKVIAVVAGWAPVMPWAMYCVVLTGRPLPSTFSPNGGGLGMPDWAYLRAALGQLAGDQPAATVLALAGIVFLFYATVRLRQWRSLLPVLWLMGLPLMSAAVAPNLRHHGRYTMPLIPVLAALAALGGWGLMQMAWHRLPAMRRQPRLTAVAATLLVLLPLVTAVPGARRWARIFAADAASIHQQHEQTGRWLAAHGGRDCHVATHDIGAIAVLSSCKVTDLIGLVTPAMAQLYVDYPDPAQRDPVMRTMLGQGGVTHVVVYPRWFPSLAADSALQPVFSARLSGPGSAGAALMVVYKTPGPEPW